MYKLFLLSETDVTEVEKEIENLKPPSVVFGEVGLAGEIRFVSQADKRLREASKLGFKYALTPACEKTNANIEQISVKSVKEAIEKSLPTASRVKQNG